MGINTFDELSHTRRNCRRMVRNRARAAAAIGAVPVPGVDIAADVGLLLELIPAINRQFGLAPEQLETLDSALRIAIQRVLQRTGARFVGVAVTKEMIIQALARVSVRLAAGAALKYVPIAGTVIASILAYHAFRTVAYGHVEDCTRVMRSVLQQRLAADTEPEN